MESKEFPPRIWVKVHSFHPDRSVDDIEASTLMNLGFGKEYEYLSLAEHAHELAKKDAEIERLRGALEEIANTYYVETIGYADERKKSLMRGFDRTRSWQVIAREALAASGNQLKIGTTTCIHGTPTDQPCAVCRLDQSKDGGTDE